MRAASRASSCAVQRRRLRREQPLERFQRGVIGDAIDTRGTEVTLERGDNVVVVSS